MIMLKNTHNDEDDDDDKSVYDGVNNGKSLWMS